MLTLQLSYTTARHTTQLPVNSKQIY